MKNAMSIGIITLCPTTISPPSAHIPNNSIDRRTGNGISFINKVIDLLILKVQQNSCKGRSTAMLQTSK
jgi:hypothetical protein